MLLDEIKSVLSFSAFRPDADDPDVPWAKRFEGRKTLLLNVSRTQTSWRCLNRKGKLEEGGLQDGEFADIAPQRAEEWRAMSDAGWCLISINHRFIISLESNLMRGENCVSLLRSNPRAVLGPKYDRGKRYAVCHHPDTTASLMMACEESMVKVTEDVLKTIGMRPARVCCGLFAMTENALVQIHDEKKGGNPAEFVLVVANEGSLSVIAQQEGTWSEVRCRSGLGQEAVETSVQIIGPLVSKIASGTPVYFVTDGQDPKYRDEMMMHLEKLGAEDLTQEDYLWDLLVQH